MEEDERQVALQERQGRQEEGDEDPNEAPSLIICEFREERGHAEAPPTRGVLPVVRVCSRHGQNGSSQGTSSFSSRHYNKSFV